MKLLDQYKELSNTGKVPTLDENMLTQILSKYIILNFDNKEGIHHIIDSFFLIFWRNLPESKVIVSFNLDSPKLTYIIDQFDLGMTKVHRHDYIEMAYVVEGEFSQMIGGKKHSFSRGSIVVIDRNSEHADYVKNQDNFVIFICMHENFFDEIFLAELGNSNLHQFIRKALLEQKGIKQFLKFTPKGDDFIYPLIEQVCAEKSMNKKGSNYIVKGLMIRIFDFLTREYETDLTTTQLNKMNDLLFIEVEEFMRKNYKDVSLKKLSYQFHFQEDYFTRLIKKHTGLTFSGFLQKIRISKAEELLLNTNMTIAEIVEAIGYMNRSYFYKLFQKTYRMTPEQYRKNGWLLIK
ncbi:AraC-like DNA-binding protein/mannose-6-phosphate isomerase-like protein (cupin superfamily) [Paenibacillus intestini]|nr:AraC-like DNA-binding protein/mannose-6-phosphate isomerase-like protein (cupin superfamily) [Paenibacillus intestini]